MYQETDSSHASSDDIMGARKRPSVKRKYLIIIGVLSTIICVALIVTVVELTKKTKESRTCVGACAAAAYLTKFTNFSADPCEDFYEYACGLWSLEEIPKYQGSIDPTFKKKKEIDYKLLNILNKNMYVKNENLEIIQTVMRYYDACKDLKSINETSIGALKELLTETGYPPMINSTFDANKFDWLTTLALMQVKTGVSILIKPQLSTDYLNSSRFLMELGRTALASFSPDGEARSFYKFYVFKYLSHLVNDDLGMKGVDMYNVSDEIVDFEDEIRNLYSKTIKDRADHVLIKDLIANISGVDWMKYFDILSSGAITEDDVVLIPDLDYLRNLVEFMNDSDNKRKTANYIAWQVVGYLVNVMPGQYREFLHEYSTKYYDIETPDTRDSVCLTILNQDFKYLTDHLYVSHFFDHEDITYVRNISNMLKEEFRLVFNESDWMDEETKKMALTKLEKLRIQLGYEDFLADVNEVAKLYEPLRSIGKIGNVALKNALIMKEFNTRHNFDLLQKPRGLELTRAASIDAAYDRGLNALGISAGMFSPPHFFSKAPDYVNFGSIGAIIGHELTHGYDIRGRLRNEDGNYENWWSSSSEQDYRIKTECFEDQYSKYTVNILVNRTGNDDHIILHLNGKNTIAENLADNVGIRLSYNAYQSWLKTHKDNTELPGLEGLSKSQMFFLAFAKTHCRKINAAGLENEVRRDAYSPVQFRVNVPLRNFNKFSEAFNCREGDGMYIKDPCIMW